MMNRQNRGFTLIELSTCLVIIGLLAAIGVPNYRAYLHKVKKSEAYQTLSVMITGQKTYFTENRQFYSLQTNPTDASGFAFSPKADWANVGYPAALGTNMYFVYSVTAGQFDGTGTPTAGTAVAAVLQPADQPMVYLSESLNYDGVDSDCGVDNTPPTFFGVEDHPPGAYNWAILMAKGNMNYDSRNCQFILLVLESSFGADATEVDNRKGFLEFDTESF